MESRIVKNIDNLLRKVDSHEEGKAEIRDTSKLTDLGNNYDAAGDNY